MPTKRHFRGGFRVAAWSAIALLGVVACGDPGGASNSADSGSSDLPTIWPDATATDGSAQRDESSWDASATAETATDSVPSPDTTTSNDVANDVVGTPDGQAPTTFYGGVLLSEVDSEFLNTALATARFTNVPLPEPEQEFGVCGVSFADPDVTAPTAYGYDAGLLNVNTTPPVVLTPVDEGSAGTGYASNLSSELEDLLPEVAALVTVSGQGGADIGAFTLIVQAPEPIAITTPNVGGLGTSASKSAPLSVTWPAKNGDQVLISLNPLTSDLIPGPKSGPAMACVVDGDPGSFSIPVAALAVMGDGNHALAVTRLKSKSGTDASGASISATLTRSSGGIISFN